MRSRRTWVAFIVEGSSGTTIRSGRMNVGQARLLLFAEGSLDGGRPVEPRIIDDGDQENIYWSRCQDFVQGPPPRLSMGIFVNSNNSTFRK